MSASSITVEELHDVPLDQLIPYDNNPRKNDKAVQAVANSLAIYGLVKNSVVVDENMVLLTGHTTLKAITKLGWATVPRVTKVIGMTEGQKKGYRIADNKTGEIAEWDISKLLDEIEGMEAEGIDYGEALEQINFSEHELEELSKGLERHNAKFQLGQASIADKVEFIEDEEKAMSLPEQDKALFEGKDTIGIIYSGGIDSTFSLLWAKTNFPDKRIIAVFSDPGVELPGAALHCYQVCEHLGVEFQLVKPKKDFMIEVVRHKGWPSTVFPWCQSDFVYDPINTWFLENLDPEKSVIMDGSRGDQVTRLSKKTKRSKSIEKRMYQFTYYHPGFDIARDTVKAILEKSGVPLWWGYKMGFVRTACWCCPSMCGEQALAVQENFPGLAAFIKKMEKYMGLPIEQMNCKSFEDKVEIGKRQRARKAKGEAPEEEIIDKIGAVTAP